MYNILVNILFTFGSTLTIYFFLNKIDWDTISKIYQFIYVDKLLLEDVFLDTEISTEISNVQKIIKYEDNISINNCFINMH